MRIKKAAKDAKVATPKFELDGFFKVTFKREGSQLVASDNQSVANRLQSAAIGCQSTAPADRKQTIVSLLRKQEQVRVSELINIIGITEGRIRDLLREMVNDGTIEKIGKNRYAYYILKKK